MNSNEDPKGRIKYSKFESSPEPESDIENDYNLEGLFLLFFS